MQESHATETRKISTGNYAGVRLERDGFQLEIRGRRKRGKIQG
jgi:hypothetical protein